MTYLEKYSDTHNKKIKGDKFCIEHFEKELPLYSLQLYKPQFRIEFLMKGGWLFQPNHWSCRYFPCVQLIQSYLLSLLAAHLLRDHLLAIALVQNSLTYLPFLHLPFLPATWPHINPITINIIKRLYFYYSSQILIQNNIHNQTNMLQNAIKQITTIKTQINFHENLTHLTQYSYKNKNLICSDSVTNL